MNDFDPDWTIHPGAHVAEWMDEHGQDAAGMAAAMRIGIDDVKGVLSGAIEIDGRIAEKLAAVVGNTARHWLALERNFRADLAAGKEWAPCKKS